jgi:hypothetical protein
MGFDKIRRIRCLASYNREVDFPTTENSGASSPGPLGILIR